MWRGQQSGVGLSRSCLYVLRINLHLPKRRKLHLVRQRWGRRRLWTKRFSFLPKPEHVQRLLPGLMQREL